MRTAWLVVGLLATACGARPLPRSQSSARLPFEPRGSFLVTRWEGALGYSGSLTAAGLDALIDADDGSARALFVRSSGGDVGVGIDFGEWVRDRKLDVVVVDFCVSSCANYVFPAGAQKKILPGGVVAWHGDAHQDDLEDRARAMLDRGYDFQDLERALALLADLRERETAFFASVGVSECICRFGNEELGARGAYFMSATDMRRFGIRNITEGPARETDVAAAIRDRGPLTFVSIPEDWRTRRTCR